MDREWEAGTDPITLGVLIGDDNEVIGREFDKCRGTLLDLVDAMETMAMTNGIVAEAPRLRSRSMHYEYRLKRIPIAKLSPEQQAKLERDLKRYVRAKTTMEQILHPNEDGYAELNSEMMVSGFSDTVGRMNSTTHGEINGNGPNLNNMAPPLINHVNLPFGNQQTIYQPPLIDLTNPTQQQVQPPGVTMPDLNQNQLNATTGPTQPRFGVTFDNGRSVFEYTGDYSVTGNLNPQVTIPMTTAEREHFFRVEWVKPFHKHKCLQRLIRTHHVIHFYPSHTIWCHMQLTVFQIMLLSHSQRHTLARTRAQLPLHKRLTTPKPLSRISVPK